MNPVRITVGKSRRIFRAFLAIIALSAMSISVWAKNDSNNTVSATIEFTKAIKVGNTELAAGVYKVTVDGNQAKFQQGKKVVAQVPCTLKDIPSAPATTGYSLDENSRLSEIQIKGSTKAIEFSS